MRWCNILCNQSSHVLRSTLSGVVSGHTTDISSLSGNLNTTNTTVSTLSGQLALKEDILTFNNGLSRVGNTIGLTNGSNGEILTMSGGLPVWLTPTAVSVPVTSVF